MIHQLKFTTTMLFLAKVASSFRAERRPFKFFFTDVHNWKQFIIIMILKKQNHHHHHHAIKFYSSVKQINCVGAWVLRASSHTRRNILILPKHPHLSNSSSRLSSSAPMGTRGVRKTHPGFVVKFDAFLYRLFGFVG